MIVWAGNIEGKIAYLPPLYPAATEKWMIVSESKSVQGKYKSGQEKCYHSFYKSLICPFSMLRQVFKRFVWSFIGLILVRGMRTGEMGEEPTFISSIVLFCHQDPIAPLILCVPALLSPSFYMPRTFGQSLMSTGAPFWQYAVDVL